MGMARQMAGVVSRRSRQRKFDAFMEVMRPTPTTTILDIGVSDDGYGATGRSQDWPNDNFLEAWYPWPTNITAVSVHDFKLFSRAFPSVGCISGDGCLLPFGDYSFDIAFSNAVIEHVGDEDRQRAFMSEICRVARYFFVTTPNRLFPIEVHTLMPVAHWLPSSMRHRAFKALKRPWGATFGLLTPRQFRQMLPVDAELLNKGMTLVSARRPTH